VNPYFETVLVAAVLSSCFPSRRTTPV
jgi:hypothetical protein